MNSRAARRKRVVVIGAGMGGLASAIDLAASGFRVTLVERHAEPGGKMRELSVDGQGIDSGPTVFTMRWVFDELFEAAGRRFDEQLALTKLETLARHSWLDGSRLDLYADVERTAAAIAGIAGSREADAYRRFAADSQRIFETLDHSFMRVERPGPVSLGKSLGLGGVPKLLATKPFTTLWSELGRRFADRRLRQLFGRYATYCGSSPLEAPATLMLIAHAERTGVWVVQGGMQRLAEAMAKAAADSGVELRYSTTAEELVVKKGRISGVALSDGSLISADAVIFNGDVAALSAGLLGRAASAALPNRQDEKRSLAAITWSMRARANGFPLEHHTVFFGDNYVDEFDSLFKRQTITAKPTVYVCAQDRKGDSVPGEDRSERLLLLINAPPQLLEDDLLSEYEQRTFDHLSAHGLTLDMEPDAAIVSTPNDYARLFAAGDGAIYGWPTHGWSGSFRRNGSRSKIAGLYLAGGTVHPGPGVPMTALSGRIAAASVRADLVD